MALEQSPLLEVFEALRNADAALRRTRRPNTSANNRTPSPAFSAASFPADKSYVSDTTLAPLNASDEPAQNLAPQRLHGKVKTVEDHANANSTCTTPSGVRTPVEMFVIRPACAS
jgi:hypothetical protein